MRAIILLLILLTGCSKGPAYIPPIDTMPEQWKNSESIETCSMDHFIWWEAFNDPVLESLLKKAEQQNLDLSLACTRIQEARLELKGKQANRYPRIDGSLAGGHFYTGNGRLLREIAGCSCHHKKKRSINFFEAGFDASWEIDLFGAVQHEINASQAKVEAVEENYWDAWVTLSAEVARNYIELRSLQQHKNLLQENIVSQEDAILLIQQLLNIGDASSLDLLIAENELNELYAQRPLLDLGIEKSLLTLSILLGEVPSSTLCELEDPAPLPSFQCERPLFIPSELLQRRPDIRQAERELAAATEMIGVAVASLYPRLSITAFIGDISTQLKQLTCSSATWLAAPQILFPLFNSRMLQQDVSFNKIRTEQALLKYQKTVIKGLEEVERALASLRYESERNDILQQALEKNRLTFELTLDLFQRGVNDYLTVIRANRSLISAQESYLQSNAELLVQYVALYKALGGTPFCDSQPACAGWSE